MEIYDVLIIGGGHGGARAGVALRQHGFEGTIAMIGKESVLPYERPALTKEYLSGSRTFEQMLIRPVGFWADKRIELLLGVEIVNLDPTSRTVTAADGRKIGYRELVWSAGGSPRKLACPGAELPGVHLVRSKADVDAITGGLAGGTKRVVVIGGGYIGLESAAALAMLGHDVVLLETLDRVLARVSGEDVSRFIETKHRLHGVDVRLQTSVMSLEETSGNVTGVRLVGGELLPCDLAIVGVGIEPSIGPLEKAGAKVSNGVDVDSYCRTSLPHIYAIGDCACHANPYVSGDRVRLESVQNASDMAATVAKAICGGTEPYDSMPWFWSNQFDLKLQTVGLNTGYDEVVLRGYPANDKFSVLYLRAGRCIALDCINSTRDYVQGKKLIEAGVIIASDLLRQHDVSLKELLHMAEN